MDRSQGGDVEMFMSVTGASEAVALQKLQAHGGGLNAAIDSFFNEGENPVPQMQAEEANRVDWMEVDEPVQSQPARPSVLPPHPVPTPPAWGTGFQTASGLGVELMGAPRHLTRGTAPIVSQPREVREIPIDWKDEEDTPARRHAPLIEEIPATEVSQLPSQSHGRIIVDDEDVPSTASSIFRAGGEATGRPILGRNTFSGDFSARNQNLNAPLIDEVPAMANDEGNDIEEAMLLAAIEASKKEASRRMSSDYPEGMLGAGADQGGMHTEDDDLARAVSLSLKTAEREKALRDRQGFEGVSEEGFMQEEDEDEHPFAEDMRKLGIFKRRGSTSTADNPQIDTGIQISALPVDETNIRRSGSGLNAAPSSPTEEAEELEEQPLLRRRSSRRLGSVSTQSEVGSATPEQELPAPQQESSGTASLAPDDFRPSAPPQRNSDAFVTDEWGGISSEEQEEAVMLEAAMFGTLPEDAALRFRYPAARSIPGGSDAPLIDDTGTRNYAWPVPQPPSPTVVAQRLLREQQDDEYLASLEADREKEVKAQIEAEARRKKEAEDEAAAHAEEQLRQEEELRKRLAEEELETQLAAKRAALPAEPAQEDDSAVTLLVRMPDGTRRGRRFRKSETLQSLFDFIDVNGGVSPGSYRLVRQYPRQAFTDAEHGLSFSDLGLSSKQEALFLELI